MVTKLFFVFAVLFMVWCCAWAVNTITDCKKNNILIKDKISFFWSNPFWIGPEKMEHLRCTVFQMAGYIVFFVHSLDYLIKRSMLQKELSFLHNFSYTTFYIIMLLMITLLAKHSLKQRLFIVLLEFIFVAEFFVVEKSLWTKICVDFIPLLALLIIANELKTEKIFKVFFVTQTSFFVVNILLSATGIIESGDISNLESRCTESGWFEMRYALGFIHPNTAGIVIAGIVVMWLIIRNEKIKWWDWAIYLTAVAVVTFVIDSRGALLFLIVFAVVFIAFKYFSKLYDFSILKYTAILTPLILTVLTFVCALFFNKENAVWNKLNGFSTGRIFLIKDYFEKYNFSILGQLADKEVDNAYMCTYVQKGLVVLLLIVLLYGVLIKRLWNKKATPELALVLAYMVYFLLEDGIINIVLNITLYLFSSIILLKPESEQQLFHNQHQKIKPFKE